MNHRGTETTEIFTEGLLNLALLDRMKYEYSEGAFRALSRNSVLLRALCISVVSSVNTGR